MKITSIRLYILLISSLIFFCNCSSLRFNLHRKKRAAVGPLWPDRKIPYAFSNIIEFNFDERIKIKDALKEIQTSLIVDGEICIEFVERINEDNYILFTDTGDCSSGIGFFPGKNKISLADECLNTGTIIHEVMHRLGFDHEHSRHDRDQNVKILFNNTSNKENFELNNFMKYDVDAPYDFHSVIHYNSDALQNKNGPTLLSKSPILISDANEIYHKRDKLTPIDVYKLQRLYKCKTIDKPDTNTDLNQEDLERADKLRKRFKIEAKFNGISDDLIEKYTNHTFNYCGIKAFWPLNYPLIESNHGLYKLMCIKRKYVGERCRFSIECQDDSSICIRPFFTKVGYCVKSNNSKFNEISQTVNDSLFEYGKMVKDTVENLKRKIFG